MLNRSMQSNSGVKAVCRRCGKTALASDFVLDHIYRLMVCPNCIKERKDKDNLHIKLEKEKGLHKEQEKNKPAGWDAEDEYLEMVCKQKAAASGNLQRIDKDRINYKCPKCKRAFIYNQTKRFPNTCPFCGSEIRVFKFGQ